MNSVFFATFILIIKLAVIITALTIFDILFSWDTAAWVSGILIISILGMIGLGQLDLYRRALKHDQTIWPFELLGSGLYHAVFLIALYLGFDLIELTQASRVTPDLVMSNLRAMPEALGNWMYQLWHLTPVLWGICMITFTFGVYLSIAPDFGLPVPPSLSAETQRREHALENELDRKSKETANLKQAKDALQKRAEEAEQTVKQLSAQLEDHSKTEAALRQELVRSSIDIEREKDHTKSAIETMENAVATARGLEGQLAELNTQAARQDQYIEQLLKRLQDAGKHALSGLPQDEQGYTQFSENAFMKAAQNDEPA